MKCANCANPADYLVKLTGVRPVKYCRKCLPKHLTKRAEAGEFPMEFAKPIPVPEVKEAPKPSKRKAKTAPAEKAVEVPQEQLEAAVEAGYKADATDGDDDGLVQDTTPFERPVGDVLVEYADDESL
jgi:hypothetical protein